MAAYSPPQAHFRIHVDTRHTHRLHIGRPPALTMAPASAPIDDSVDYYDFLSIESTATDQEIQHAYRRTNLKYHPDKFKPTPETSIEQAADKLDLLQKILVVLKDPAARARYDQGRESRRRNVAARQKMESERKKKAEKLSDREKKAAAQVNGAKRKYNELDQAVQDAQAHSLSLKHKMEKRKHEEAARHREAAEAQTKQDTSEEPDEKHRLVKITWVREGEGLDIDEDVLKEMCEGFGPVETVKVMKDKKRRLDGQKEKSVYGSGLVAFASLSAAQEAVRRASWDGIESVAWVPNKHPNAG